MSLFPLSKSLRSSSLPSSFSYSRMMRALGLKGVSVIQAQPVLLRSRLSEHSASTAAGFALRTGRRSPPLGCRALSNDGNPFGSSFFPQPRYPSPLFPSLHARRACGLPRKAVVASVQVGGLTIEREEVVREDDPTNNVSDTVFSKLGASLHTRPDHPLCIIKEAIFAYFDKRHPGLFATFDDLPPIVSVKANFDDVLVPPDHVSRSYNDTYYVSADTVLRCHTSAHQAEMLRNGQTHFLVTGDVYRRDEIDATHYPVFHQMEGVRVFQAAEWEQAGTSGTDLAVHDLKGTLEGLARHLFGDVEMRWVDCYFPFTDPSFELEIFFNGKWLEVLGCGVMEQAILDNAGRPQNKAWAFGLGLERLAMVLFGIPDIRLFWSSDKRFTEQFTAGSMNAKFKPFSKYPPCFKDISFWISDRFTQNNFCELVRDIAGDLVEEVALIDEFTNKKTGKTSHCYRITYRSMERSLTDDEINAFQARVRDVAAGKLLVELR